MARAGLDWMLDEDKEVFDVDRLPNLAVSLVEVFDSQISGSKRYGKATMGRRLANATYAEANTSDTSQALIYAMDLSPLVEDDALDIKDYVLGYIERLKEDVSKKIDGLI